MRTLVGRLLMHLALTAVVVVTPALAVLCYSSCFLEAGAMADAQVASDATPACHDDDTRHHSPPASDSAPLQDDCTHAGDSFSSGQLRSAKSVGGDRLQVPVIVTTTVVYPFIFSSDIRRDASSISSGGQRLGRFLTPLRI